MILVVIKNLAGTRELKARQWVQTFVLKVPKKQFSTEFHSTGNRQKQKEHKFSGGVEGYIFA